MTEYVHLKNLMSILCSRNIEKYLEIFHHWSHQFLIQLGTLNYDIGHTTAFENCKQFWASSDNDSRNNHPEILTCDAL